MDTVFNCLTFTPLLQAARTIESAEAMKRPESKATATAVLVLAAIKHDKLVRYCIVRWMIELINASEQCWQYNKPVRVLENEEKEPKEA